MKWVLPSRSSESARPPALRIKPARRSAALWEELPHSTEMKRRGGMGLASKTCVTCDASRQASNT